MESRLAKCSLALMGLTLLLVSCSIPRQTGGKAVHTIVRGGITNRTELVQSENPKEPSTQTTESTSETDYVLPAGSRLELPPTPVGTNWVRQFAVLHDPVPVRAKLVDRTSTTIGAAQKDLAAESAVKFASMRPVLIFGILMLAGAAALAYFGWWTKAAIFAGGGIGAICIAQVLPSHEYLIIGCAIGAAVILSLLVLYTYHKGAFDLAKQAPSPVPTPQP